MAERFGEVGKKTVMCHSAGTQLCLEAIRRMSESDLQNVNFIFDSPRMEFGQFDEIIRSRNLSRNQITVIASVGDLPHWPDPSLLSQDDVNDPFLVQRYLDNSRFDYGYNPDPSYRYLLLETDLTARRLDIDPLLGHGSMFEGEISGHRYVIEVNGNGNERENTTISDAYHDRNQ